MRRGPHRSTHTDTLLPDRARFRASDALYAYLLENSLGESERQRRRREETAARPGAGMQIAPEQGQFMALLVELTGARRCLEIGTFTGYSALAVAQALPDDGRLVACDVNETTDRKSTRLNSSH